VFLSIVSQAALIVIGGDAGQAAIAGPSRPCEPGTATVTTALQVFGALGGTRTPTMLLTATSRQRVYQFRHERFLKIGTGFAPDRINARM
jgi:hypothetical protein